MKENILPVCLICMTTTFDRSTCSCGNVGCIKDIDGTLNIYVEDIRTCRLADVILDGNGVERYRDLKTAFELQPFIDYREVKSSVLNFKDYVPRNNYVRKSKKRKIDKALVKYLDRHEDVTAAEGRVGTTKKRVIDPISGHYRSN